MMKVTSVALAFVVLSGASAAAQAPPAAADMSEKLLGTWEGPYQSDMAPPGGIRLVAAIENGAWRVTIAVISDQELPSSEISDFKVEGGVVSWSQEIMGLDCRSQASIENGVLKGGTECSSGGALAITATFLLQKK